MFGKLTVLLALSAAVVTAGMFQNAPERIGPRSATLVAAEFFDSVKQPDAVARLRDVLTEFHAHPSMQLAYDVEEAFAAFDDHLAELRRKARSSVGGSRAELEIRRIELERERELYLQRYQEVSNRTSFAVPEVRRGNQMQIASTVLSGALAD